MISYIVIKKIFKFFRKNLFKYEKVQSYRRISSPKSNPLWKHRKKYK